LAIACSGLARQSEGVPLADDLFALNAGASARCEWLGGKVPVLLVDHLYAHPDEVREAALELNFSRASSHYPGKLAAIPGPGPSKDRLLRWVRELANSVFLTLWPVTADGRPITSFREVFTDFAIVDRHPEELTPDQQRPHVDPVPVFGLVYLNREERGGTLFFERTGEEEPAPGGYFTDTEAGYQLIGRIQPRFNRLAIYPGTIPHSGEIIGDWIEGDQRFSSPRLTQRLLFAP